MKGAKMTSTLLEMLSGGGIRIWTLVLRGGLNRFVHFFISGIWLCKIRLVAGHNFLSVKTNTWIKVSYLDHLYKFSVQTNFTIK